MIKKIMVMFIFFASNLTAAPITFLSPNNLNTPSGYSITSTGLYFLTDDVVFTNLANSQNGITITSSNVVLDLNGKILQGTTGGTAQSAISIATGGYTNITIKNGTILNWSGSGVIAAGLVSDILIDSLFLQGVLGTGAIQFGISNRLSIKNCVVGGCNNTGGGINLVNGGSSIEIVNCMVEDNNLGVGCFLATVSATAIRKCRFNNGLNGGIQLLTGNSFTLEDSLFINALNGGAFGLFATGSSIVTNCIGIRSGAVVDAASKADLFKDNLMMAASGSGFFNQSSDSVFMNCIATRNTLSGFTPNSGGIIAAISISNGATVPAGTRIDPVNNISLYGPTNTN
jgi:hypothetical protein